MQNSWKAKAISNAGLIKELHEYGIIKSKPVEHAMRATDRGKYCRSTQDAYVDSPQSIGHNVTISAPHMHAYCLELMKDHLKPGAKVLDVGSGSGYLSACLARMVGPKGKVVGIDVIPELVEFAIKNVKNDDPTLLSEGLIEFKVKDGWKGDPDNAPFDSIHVGAAAATVPEALLQQLKDGGRLVIPEGTSSQSLNVYDKIGSEIKMTQMMGVRYVPLVKTE